MRSCTGKNFKCNHFLSTLLGMPNEHHRTLPMPTNALKTDQGILELNFKPWKSRIGAEKREKNGFEIVECEKTADF